MSGQTGVEGSEGFEGALDDDFDFPASDTPDSGSEAGEADGQISEGSLSDDVSDQNLNQDGVEDAGHKEDAEDKSEEKAEGSENKGGKEMSPEEEIAYLREQLNITAGQLLGQANGANKSAKGAADKGTEVAAQQPQPQHQPQPQPQQSLAMPRPGETTTLDFLQGQDHVDILSDAGKFNSLLNQVATVAFTAAVNAAQERIMTRIPEIVQASAQQQMEIHGMTERFYEANPDLVPYKQAVSMAAMQIHNEKPELALPDLLKGAAERTRNILRLTKTPAAPTSGARQRRPAQPAGGSIRSQGGNRTPSGAPQMTDMERQIADLLDL